MQTDIRDTVSDERESRRVKEVMQGSYSNNDLNTTIIATTTTTKTNTNLKQQRTINILI